MVEDVLAFWFGADPKQWFMRDEAFDGEIRSRFGDLHAEIAAGGHEDWRRTARGELALIIVLDQWSRNLYRDDPRAFAQDARAVTVARELLESGRIRALAPQEQMFALMPLMHAEDRATQRQSVAAFEQVAREHPSPTADTALDFAKKHAAVIEKFGRFPHRNAVLGRDSSPDELTFIRESGRGF
ncbi:MAG TPA: DUF924 family protein [Kofleriaceae bacterium]|nr:DUF924 family protein [Kofleriaceae bacterium]